MSATETEKDFRKTMMQLCTSDSRTAISYFKAYLERLRTSGPTRTERYDIHFLCALMSMLYNYNEEVIYSLKGRLVNANNDVLDCLPTKPHLKFFMEDIYTDDLDRFIQEYDMFTVTNRSDFFFKANVVNIAMLFKCYHKRCFDLYLEPKLKAKSDLDQIWHMFEKKKKDLIPALILAYTSCEYQAVCNLYVVYLKFYGLTVSKFLDTNVQVIGQPFYPTKMGSIYGKRTKVKALKKMQFAVLDAVSRSRTKNYYVYLSCSHVAEYKQSRFYMTRFIDSHIGHEWIHGDLFLSTFDVIGHDFYFHGNLERVQAASDQMDAINRQFIMELYQQPVAVYQYGMYVIQIIQNEYEKNTPLNLGVHFYRLFLELKNNKLILRNPEHSQETVHAFLQWLLPMDFRLTHFGQEGTGYKIVIK